MTNKDFLKTLSLEKTRLEHELAAATEKADYVEEIENTIEKIKSLMEMYED